MSKKSIKKSPKRKFYLTTVLFISLILGFFLMYIYFNSQISELHAQNQILHKELVDINGPRIMIEKSTEQYNFSTFGIYSPLFEEKNVHVEKIKYQGNYILEKEITVQDPETGLDVSVTVWNTEGTILPEIKELKGIYFDDWQDFSKDFKDTRENAIDKFINSSQIPMYFTYDEYGGRENPNQITQTNLFFYKQYSPLDELVVRLRIGFIFHTVSRRTNQQKLSVQEMRSVLTRVANTITDK